MIDHEIVPAVVPTVPVLNSPVLFDVEYDPEFQSFGVSFHGMDVDTFEHLVSSAFGKNGSEVLVSLLESAIEQGDTDLRDVLWARYS